jgi:hypothetical protein
VIWSAAAKKVALIELTCPAEENIAAATVTKSARYAPLAELIRESGWEPAVFPIEVGARGHVAHSVRRCLATLGLGRPRCSRVCKALAVVAARCSYAIWLARNGTALESGRELIVLDPEPDAQDMASEQERMTKKKADESQSRLLT